MSTPEMKKICLPSRLSQACLAFLAPLTLVLWLFAAGPIQAQDHSAGDNQGFIGIEVKNSAAPRGALVVKVLPDSPAQHAGIKPGNIILKINKTAITSSADFYRATAKLSPGTFFDAGVIQNNTKVTRGVQVGHPPGSNQAKPLFKGSKKQVFGYMGKKTDKQTLKKQPGNTPGLTIIDLIVSKKTIAPGADFEIAMALLAENAREKGDNVRISMIYTMKKEGRVITAAEPETLTLPNGMPVNIMRTCRAKKEPGSYEILIKLEMAGIVAEKSVKFAVK